jgi:hypothetical protein
MWWCHVKAYAGGEQPHKRVCAPSSSSVVPDPAPMSAHMLLGITYVWAEIKGTFLYRLRPGYA